MAKKKSPAELKTEGEELGKQLVDARKKQLNFALSIGKDGLFLETDLKKNPDVLWRNAKKAGGGAKGGRGQINVKGKTVELTCNDDNVPKNLALLAKKFFSERGQAYKFIITTPSGELSEGDDEKAEETQETARKGAAASPEESKEQAPPADEETVAAVEEATDDTVEPQMQEAARDAGDPDEALREILKKEFDDLQSDLDQALLSTDKGAAKKAEALKGMFASQLGGDVKKSASVMTLLKNTVKDAIAAGIEGGDDTGDEAAAKVAATAARVAKMAELEKGVDELMKEFA